MRFSRSEWSSGVRSVLQRLDIVSHCVICGRPSPVEVDLCVDCESLFQRSSWRTPSGHLSGLCLSCGNECLAAGDSSLCSTCADGTPPFRRIVAPYRYAFPVDSLIQAFKYGDRRTLGRILGSLLARFAVRQVPGTTSDRPLSRVELPTVLLPVPLHRSRYQSRGFNQSAEIARWCGRSLGIDCRPRWVVREFDTGSLAGLSRAERQYRILGAFRAHDRVAGHRVAIVDDVLTTGATARELARVLYDTGAEAVELWVLARTSSER